MKRVIERAKGFLAEMEWKVFHCPSRAMWR